MQKKVSKVQTLKGSVEIPADKSISHRAVIFATLAKGKSVIKNFSTGQDPKSSLEVCSLLGVEAELCNSTLTINSTGKLSPSAQSIYPCGNSGTTMRLMAGILAGQKFNSTLTGDESLSSRPMKRIIEPLTLMGAQIEANDFKAPLFITGHELHAINYQSKLSSAQVKSCILLAGLGCDDVTKFTEPFISRNHTEIMLKSMGADICTEGTTVSIKKSELNPISMTIPGDISSAAYFIAAGLIVPDSKITLRNVGLNPTRTGILEVIKSMGANFRILNQKEVCGEIVGDIEIQHSQLKACKISGNLIPKLIDEIPIIAVLATQAEGETIISDAKDLRNKESDRITTVVTELKELGANIQETPDGMIIQGRTQLNGGVEVETYNDHRLAMSLYVAGLVCQKEILINGFEWVNISFPEFETKFEKLNPS